MARSLFFVLLLCVACGGQRRTVERCDPGEVVANPDGRGPQCVDPASDCLAPEDCTASSACCVASCQPTGGTHRFACVEDCISPACDPAAPDCPADRYCLTYSECSAACVPVLPCEDGTVVADPDGEGFRCIPADSACFRPEDCRASLDPCCQSYCGAEASGRYVCQEDCDGATDYPGGGNQDRATECYRDSDCGSYGPGWTCEGCPGYCMPPALPECVESADCVVGIDWSLCCDCDVYSRTEVDSNPCITTADVGGPEDGCEASLCDADCAECIGYPACIGGECVDSPPEAG